jgi:N-acetylglucosaminyldiphosphoundecaprenol N-acetyl-beta-D-mannosaminyltransferase
MDHEQIVARVNAAGADVLLVAMGNPKQEHWLAMHRGRLNVKVGIGIGGTLDFLAGAARRAPRWMQSSGLEWLHRTLQEPRRLARRYLHDGLGLAYHLPQQLAFHVAQPRRPRQSGVLLRRSGNTEVVTVAGDLTGAALAEFEQAAAGALAAGRNLVLDLAQVAYLGSDSLGSLIHLNKAIRQYSGLLWLAAVPPHLLRVLRTAHLDRYFRLTSSVADACYRIAKAEQKAGTTYAALLTHEAADGSAVHLRAETLEGVCERIAAINWGVSRPVEDFAAGMPLRPAAGNEDARRRNVVTVIREH